MNLITDSDELRARIREASEWSDMTHVEGDLDDIINAIIAAGWRLVPEGSIVVSREDVRIVTSVMDGVPLEPSPKRYADAMDRLYAALGDADA